jgi:hypothetical protein
MVIGKRECRILVRKKMKVYTEQKATKNPTLHLHTKFYHHHHHTHLVFSPFTTSLFADFPDGNDKCGRTTSAGLGDALAAADPASKLDLRSQYECFAESVIVSNTSGHESAWGLPEGAAATVEGGGEVAGLGMTSAAELEGVDMAGLDATGAGELGGTGTTTLDGTGAVGL